MKLDPKTMPDWQIAKEAEKSILHISEIGEKLGLQARELIPYGHYMAKIDYESVLRREQTKKDGKYIIITAITPTPLGEGKSTTTIGLLQGLGKRGKKVAAAIRQPSAGPTMGVKGSAAGGGLSQCIPLTQLSLGFTGDINAISNAHNLAMVALTSRIQHENNYNDEKFKRLSGKEKLNIDPNKVSLGFVMDFCCQALRNIVIGLGGASDGFTMQSHFEIAVASEVMSIIAICNDLKELRQRIGKIVVAYDRNDRVITTKDLEVDGAMTAWLVEAMKPNIIQSIEGQPVFVHAGPFANISIGQSSIIADKVSLKLNDYHITESGFGSDIGYEKMWNLKCHYSGLKPDAVVIVTTIRALKNHGGAPNISGKNIPEEYLQENTKLVEDGMANLLQHIDIVKQSGINPIVCINAFHSDAKSEIDLIKNHCQKLGVNAIYSKHWELGGEGALELADAVIDACNDDHSFKELFSWQEDFTSRINKIAHRIYGAKDVAIHNLAKEKIQKIEQEKNIEEWGLCMLKTNSSLSDDPSLKGAPKDWTLNIKDVKIFEGAGFIVPIAGDIKLMPGTGSNPGFKKIDVNTENGQVYGIF